MKGIKTRGRVKVRGGTRTERERSTDSGRANSDSTRGCRALTDWPTMRRVTSAVPSTPRSRSRSENARIPLQLTARVKRRRTRCDSRVPAKNSPPSLPIYRREPVRHRRDWWHAQAATASPSPAGVHPTRPGAGGLSSIAAVELIPAATSSNSSRSSSESTARPSHSQSR